MEAKVVSGGLFEYLRSENLYLIDELSSVKIVLRMKDREIEKLKRENVELKKEVTEIKKCKAESSSLTKETQTEVDIVRIGEDMVKDKLNETESEEITLPDVLGPEKDKGGSESKEDTECRSEEYVRKKKSSKNRRHERLVKGRRNGSKDCHSEMLDSKPRQIMGKSDKDVALGNVVEIICGFLQKCEDRKDGQEGQRKLYIGNSQCRNVNWDKESSRNEKLDRNRMDRFSERRCFRCNRAGHLKRDCVWARGACFGCKKVGHLVNNCPSPRNISCFKCGVIGHCASICSMTQRRIGDRHMCGNCGLLGHFARMCKDPRSICTICGREGHIADVCRNNVNANSHVMNVNEEEAELLLAEIKTVVSGGCSEFSIGKYKDKLMVDSESIVETWFS